MFSEGWDRPTVLALLILGLLLAGLVFLYLWQGTVLARLRAERASLVLSLAELEEQKLFLEHKLRELCSLETLSQEAQALGMGPVDLSRLHYLVVPDENGG